MSKSKNLVFLILLIHTSGHAQFCQDIPSTSTTSQFINNNDGTMTDTKTNLMWKKCSEGKSGDYCQIGSSNVYTWQKALSQAQLVNTTGGFGGYTDWRLPNIKELFSITENRCNQPSVNLSVFPNTDKYADFWSSSPDVNDGRHAWYVNAYGSYNTGDWYHNQNGKNSEYQVRLVRDAL